MRKVDAAAAAIQQIWAADRGDEFAVDLRAPAAGTQPAPGALQIVFCDLGVPKPGHWNIYDELRTQLTNRGMNPARIRYIHDATHRVPTAGDKFAARIGDHPAGARDEAAKAVLDLIGPAITRAAHDKTTHHIPIDLGGHRFYAQTTPSTARFITAHPARLEISVPHADIGEGHTIITRYYSCGSSGTCCGCSDSKVSGDSFASSLVVADAGA